MAGVTELGYMAFGVKDLTRWHEFATAFLGLERVPGEHAGRTYLRMDFWHHRFILEEDPVDDVTAIGLRVAGGEELDEVRHRLAQNGVAHEVCSPDQSAERHVLGLIRLKDPLGNPLELFHGPLVQFNRPFHPSRGMYGSFVTGAGGLGHCMLNGSEIPACRDFYRLLGMRGDIEYKMELTPGEVTDVLFLHCNDRDHTLAFGLPGERRMNHLMVESTSLDDVAYTHELAVQMGIPIAVKLGRHANDHMFSFYCVGPSGFMVEYGWGSRPASHQTEYYTSDTYGHQVDPEVVSPDWTEPPQAG